MTGPGDPHIPKRGRSGTGSEARAQPGPQLGLRVQAPRRQGIAPDAGGGLARARGPCEPARRRPPGRAGASVCRGPGGSPGAESGRGSARTHRPNVASSPDAGGSAVSAGRRCVERETVLAVPGCGPSAVGPPPIPPEAPWPGRRGGSLCHRHRRATVAHCHHWLSPLVVATGPTAPQLGGVALASLFFYGSSLWRGQGQGEFKDSVY